MQVYSMAMGGKLTDKDMDQLEKWIGAGPKTFNLLYAITRDGCDSVTFHQKCDNQGPTVTVLYNQQGSVYGGYTAANWQSNCRQVHNEAANDPQSIFRQQMGYNEPSLNTWTHDKTAFLFQLKFSGKQTTRKFPIVSPGHAIYNDRNFGPTFGSGHDLLTFRGTVKIANGIFCLNGRLNIGNAYQGNVSIQQINNGNMNVTELEVYSLADGRRTQMANPTAPMANAPWRKTKDWNDKLLDELTEDIEAFKPLADLKVKDARILMVGPVGAGKSSFYNTINSIFRGRITQRASSGSAEQSLTTSYTEYRVKTRSGASLNFRLCDTRGLEENQGLDVIECNYLLDGNIPNHYLFNPSKPITPKTPGFKSSPTADDMIQCGVFVLDATTLDVLPAKIVEKIKAIRNLMNEKGVPQVVLLTKVDKLCKEVAGNTSNVYKSTTVERNVDKAAQLLGLPRANVLPVKNYENELELDENLNILALLSLREILHHAEDCMENALDKILDNEESKECGIEYLKKK